MRLITVFVLGLCSLSGCTDASSPAGPVDRPVLEASATSRTVASSSDEHWAQVADRASAFAGLYFDESGDLIIRVTRMSDSLSVMRALGEELLAILPRSPKRAGKAQVRFVHADANFRVLYDIKRKISDEYANGEGIVSVGLDEVTGRIVVQSTQSGRTRTELMTSVPADLQKWMVVERGEPNLPAQPQPTVFSRQRPLTGGYEAGPRSCTMTVNAWRGFDRIVIGSSHCSATAFGLDNGPMRQPNSGVGFGTEIVDPTSYNCSTLFVTRFCRRADVTAYSVTASPPDLFPSDTLGWRSGLIARTMFVSSGLTQTDGSKDINSAFPFFVADAVVMWPIHGEVVHKVGHASGWTFGTVYGTCSDVTLQGYNVRIVCTDVAHLYAKEGDSGAPVFVPNFTNGTAVFYGVQVARTGTTGGIFSNVNQMRQDIGIFNF